MAVVKQGNKFAVVNKKGTILARYRTEQEAEIYNAKKFGEVKTEKPKKVKKVKKVEEEVVKEEE